MSTHSDNSVVGTCKDVPKPLTFVNVHKSKSDLSVRHCSLVALVDPGSTTSIVKHSFVEGICNSKIYKNTVSYNVAGGKFQTKYDVMLGISMNEFSCHSIIRHQFAIDDEENEGIGYNGCDYQPRYLCKVLGMSVNYNDCTLQWMVCQ